MPTSALPALAAMAVLAASPLALAACGGDDDDGDTTARAGVPAYEGSTDQRQPVRIEAGTRVNGSMRLLLECADGSDSRVTLTTDPERPTLESDGSFYYEETGETVASQFPGFGPGEYRGAVQGEIVGDSGTGTAAFRISFRETSCRAGVSWRVQRR